MGEKRVVEGFILPASKVVIKLRPGEEMPDQEEFAQTVHRIKDRHGAYEVAFYMHRQYAQGYPMIMSKTQALKLVEAYPQFQIFE